MISKNNTIKLIKKLKEIHPETEWKKTNQEILYSQIKSSEIHANISLLSQLYDIIERITPIKKLAYSVLTLLFVLISGSIISVRASDNSMPGDFFYNVKLIKEGISLKLSPRDKRMGLRMKFAQKRLSEVNKIIANNKDDKKQEKINLAVDNLNKDLNDVKNKLAKIDTGIAKQKTSENVNKIKPLTKVINNKNVNKAGEKKELSKVKKPLKNMLVSTGFAVIDGTEGLSDNNFLYWHLTQEQLTEYLHGIAENSTSAYPSIKPSDLEVLKINLPPLPEQQAIAEILGSLDDKIELNRKMNKTLEEMAQAIFKSCIQCMLISPWSDII